MVSPQSSTSLIFICGRNSEASVFYQTPKTTKTSSSTICFKVKKSTIWKSDYNHSENITRKGKVVFALLRPLDGREISSLFGFGSKIKIF